MTNNEAILSYSSAKAKALLKSYFAIQQLISTFDTFFQFEFYEFKR